MRAYGSNRNSVLRRHKNHARQWEPGLSADGPVKGSERLRVRVALQQALGTIPRATRSQALPEAPCTCEDCTNNPAFAAWIAEEEREGMAPEVVG